MNLKPFKAVAYNQRSIEQILERSGYIIGQSKLDGIRGLLVITANNAYKFLTRTGNEISSLSYVFNTKRLESLIRSGQLPYLNEEGLVIDCELTVKDFDFYTGSGLLRSLLSSDFNKACNATPEDKLFHLKPELLEVNIFAVLPLSGLLKDEDVNIKGFMQMAMSESIVQTLSTARLGVNFKLPETRLLSTMREIEDFYQAQRDRGNEGIILKDPDCPYRRGKVKGWFKMKPEQDEDGIIEGVIYGTTGSKYEDMVVGFVVRLESGAVVNATNMSEPLMYAVTNRVKAYGDSYYDGYQVTVKYMEKTKTGSVRHPSFSHFRGLEASPKVKA